MADALKAIKEAINATNSFAQIDGVVNLPPQSTKLFFHKDQIASSLDLLKPTDEQLNMLVNACDPASFGRNKENVMDESYRKAWKLDPTDFAINLDLAAAGLLDKIKYGMLSENRPIRAELYKLNIYRPGSFFKAHRDTPRGHNMFGSLVVVLPIPHEGGELVLRINKDKELRYNPSKTLASRGGPCLVYIAFYGDIEHEVLPVTSGNRITLTYNLFFSDDDKIIALKDTASILQHPLAIALTNALKQPDFLPDGGLLGYGLKYLYPVDRDGCLDPVRNNLKGEDATVSRVGLALRLRTSTKVIFQDDNYDPAYIHYVALDWVPEMKETPCEDGLYSEFMQEPNAIDVYWTDDAKYHEPDSKRITWFTEPSFDGPQLSYIAYGNEGTLSHSYGSFCFLINVPPFKERAGAFS